MNYIKLFENFDNIEYFDMEDIFLTIIDKGLIIEDAMVCNIIDIGDNDVVFGNSNTESTSGLLLEFSTETGLYFNSEFYNELDLAIKHAESRYDIKLNNIHIDSSRFELVHDEDKFNIYCSTVHKMKEMYSTRFDKK